MAMRYSIMFFSFALLTLTLTLHVRSGSETLPYLSGQRVLLIALIWCTSMALHAYHSARPLPVLLLDYSCFKPHDGLKLPFEVSDYLNIDSGSFTPESARFMRTITRKSGLGDETYVPSSVFLPGRHACLPAALSEVEEAIFAAAAAVLSKTDVPPDRITHLVVAASAFCPSPSLSALLHHRLHLGEDVKTLNLSGMGCSSGTVMIDLAARILRRSRGYALIVATDGYDLLIYNGNDRSMLVSNCVFRVGTAAVLLTSDSSRRSAAKMEVVSTLRTHHGADDEAFVSAVFDEDRAGNTGARLSRDLPKVAGAAMRAHIAEIAPRVLPVSEVLRYGWAAARALAYGGQRAARAVVPDFTSALEHICFHAGGRAVIDGVERMMRLGETMTEPTRMTLHRFGNTSSSNLFYQLAYLEAKGRIRAGDRVWTLGFGSGLKSCSVVWRALRDSCLDSDNPWRDCIHRYPVDIGS